VDEDGESREDSSSVPDNQVRERNPNWDVVQSVRDGEHERLMRSPSAVLVTRAAHPHRDEWLKIDAMELSLAGQIYEKNPDFQAKAVIVAEPGRIQAQAAGVAIYPWSEPFEPEKLEPFFDKLLKARLSDAR
jgi:hypothetical protein